MNKLWLIIFNNDNDIEIKQIDILEEHTIKYKVKSEFPFDSYNYIHKFNLNIVQHNRKDKIRYVVSNNRATGLQTIKDYCNSKIEAHKYIMSKFKTLQEQLNML